MQRFKNPFSKENQPAKQIKRNAFDLSHQNNLTMQMGVLYPCLCQEVIPGDTFKIDTAFGIRMLPLLFPIQTKIRVDLHYFYVRNRNLWDDWQNFITSSNSNYQFPIIRPRQNLNFGTGSLYDYLGCPTRFFSPKSNTFEFTAEAREYIGQIVYVNSDQDMFSAGYINETSQKVTINNSGNTQILGLGNTTPNNKLLKLAPMSTFNMEVITNLTSSGHADVRATLTDDHYNSLPNLSFSDLSYTGDTPSNMTFTFKNNSSTELVIDLSQTKLVLYISGGSVSFDNDRGQSNIAIETHTYQENEYLWNDVSNIKLSALPFRAYESIYNSFYRDQRNNPFKVNGVVTPNKYLPTTKGGQDNENYVLRRRNWEQDAFTTCLPQPQQGPAPVIGMSATGMATIQDADGKLYQVKLITDSTGDRIVNFETNQDVPSSIKQSALNLVNNGFTINDFRNANSLQRWLECNYRNGLKYKDQIASHFGVNIQYATLDMPEFLGGVSQFINVDQINQMSETQENPLGSYAGQGSCIGKQSHTINKYCDEHGFIMGIISINPVPVYSQNLPKHFLKTGQLDYFFPEFGHIGYQPITYNEVCPLQANLDGSGNQVLGYQRPWYEYLQAFDEIHGLFRTDFKDFVLQRQFKELPALNPEFLTISESQLNDVFAVQSGDNADRFLGQIHFNIIAKRPIPRYGIPKLE